MSEVTRLLDAAAAGDRQAAAELLPLVYDELRALASLRLAAEPAGHTLQPTALVHEAYLRLVGPSDAARWDGRGHFFAAAAEAMRRLLIDHARRKSAGKRGGAGNRVDVDPDQLPRPDRADDLLALDAALTDLAAADPAAASLVQLRFFGGMTVAEAAGVVGIAPRTADAYWAYARAWLRTRLRGGEKPEK